MRVSLFDLAAELGSDDVAAAQVLSMLLEEAFRTNTLPHVLRDLFARELCEAIPQGWKRPLTGEPRSKVAGAISSWYAELHDYLEHEDTMSAARALLDAELPDGWLPDGPDDPVVVSFVDRCLGHALLERPA
jgi:hypothetical protein